VSGIPATTCYLWCGQRLCQAVNPNGAVARSYYDEGEAVGGTQLYYGPDRLGSVREAAAVTGASATAQFYNYDPYGNPIQTRPPGRSLMEKGPFQAIESGGHCPDIPSNHGPRYPIPTCGTART